MRENTARKPNEAQKPSLKAFVADHKAEFHKITWPKRDEVAKKTVTVIVLSIIIAAIIFCMDTVFTSVQDLAMSLLGLL